MEELKEYKLSELLEIKYGKDHKTLSDGDIPCFGTGGLMRKVEKFIYDKESILIPRKGTLSNLFYVNKPFWTVDTLFWSKINMDLAYPKFLYYKLKTLDLSNLNEGSAIPSLTTKTLNQINIEMPPLETQQKIASILSSLDDKIELNNEMNKTLEEMASTLFKRWFIDFEFPNELGEPYRTSGGKMVERGLGEIPEGWRVESIYDFANYINGASFKSTDCGEKGVPIIKIAELKNGISDTTKFCTSQKDEKYYLKNNDILFSWSGNPETSIDTFIWHKGGGILNQHIFRIIPYENYSPVYVYNLLKYLKPQFSNIASQKQTTGLGHVTVKDLKNLKVPLDDRIISEFSKLSNHILKQMIVKLKEIQSLTQLRDTLLPKLMSGEVEV